jgi:hypothetical protein
VSSSMPCLWKEEVPLPTDIHVYFSIFLVKKGPKRNGVGTETECHSTYASETMAVNFVS